MKHDTNTNSLILTLVAGLLITWMLPVSSPMGFDVSTAFAEDRIDNEEETVMAIIEEHPAITILERTYIGE